MTDEPKLKPCPCGKVPERIGVVLGHSPNYSWAVPSCCGRWGARFDSNKVAPGECERGARAWNDATRATGEWLDQPDGPGWWWYSHNKVFGTREVFQYQHSLYVYVATNAGKAEASQYPGKWQRAIVPEPPEEET